MINMNELTRRNGEMVIEDLNNEEVLTMESINAGYNKLREEILGGIVEDYTEIYVGIFSDARIDDDDRFDMLEELDEYEEDFESGSFDYLIGNLGISGKHFVHMIQKRAERILKERCDKERCDKERWDKERYDKERYDKERCDTERSSDERECGKRISISHVLFANLEYAG